MKPRIRHYALNLQNEKKLINILAYDTEQIRQHFGLSKYYMDMFCSMCIEEDNEIIDLNLTEK